MSSVESSKDSDALLGKSITTTVTVRPPPLPWSNTNTAFRPVWSSSSSSSASASAAVELPIVDPNVIENRRLIAPHADLIELTSSTENLSLCGSDSSADYKSCDGEEVFNDLANEHDNSSVVEFVLDPEVCTTQTGSHCFRPPIDIGSPFLKRLPQCPSAAQLSVTSSNSDPTIPTCRICHLTASGGGGSCVGDEHDDGLISPCRCSGTMQYIHSACLMKWLEVSSRKSKRPPSCELCLYQYHRHKKFKADHWKFPECTLRDKILHILFFLSLLTMIGSATVTILCFKHDKALIGHRATISAAVATSTSTASLGGAAAVSGAGAGAGSAGGFDRNRLTHSEVVTLVCGVLFFVAFFLAMYVEVKSRSTIYKLITDFLYLNQQWYIDDYDKKTDVQSIDV